MRQRVTLSALAMIFAAVFAVTGNATALADDSSAPETTTVTTTSQLGWGWPL